jgi:hypothetical protein
MMALRPPPPPPLKITTPETELLKEPGEDEVVPGPPTTPELTDLELNSDHQVLRPDAFQAAIYTVKGKAMAEQSRPISDSSSDSDTVSRFLSRPSLFFLSQAYILIEICFSLTVKNPGNF